ncbi:Syntaxin-binding protein 5-like [Eumeta japonica]|uniref:Syntaxin-binding protein 5-like n=1 Tax=Eumeta variegata TaxID=151549 RepID=A0A4C1ZC39_EUMVA|nr:Syntaxin-binding protein 5-like [Eumeta japonica]
MDAATRGVFLVRITCLHLPLQSRWLHVGTERGNVHVVHIETFVLSGYVINWNKAIEVEKCADERLMMAVMLVVTLHLMQDTAKRARGLPDVALTNFRRRQRGRRHGAATERNLQSAVELRRSKSTNDVRTLPPIIKLAIRATTARGGGPCRGLREGHAYTRRSRTLRRLLQCNVSLLSEFRVYTRASHPGAVVDISDNPLDANKLLIAFENGPVVVWDLRARAVEWRGCLGAGAVGASEGVRAAAWQHDGKLMTAHADGALATWTMRAPRPISLIYPHAKANKDGKLEACKPIHRLEWKTSKNGPGPRGFKGPPAKSSQSEIDDMRKNSCSFIYLGSDSSTIANYLEVLQTLVIPPDSLQDFRLQLTSVLDGFSESLVIFSGGLPTDKAGRTHSITVLNGKSTTVLEMEHSVVDFVTLCESPWTAGIHRDALQNRRVELAGYYKVTDDLKRNVGGGLEARIDIQVPKATDDNNYQEPYAVVVLLQKDLVVIDLLSPGYPCFENPYPMDLHESPVTCCSYFADCPSDLIPAFYSVGRAGNKRQTGFSERPWPVDGGEWTPASCSYSEIILTGHADGSVKFWDASAGILQILYKLKCSKVFERRAGSWTGNEEESPLAVQLVTLCAESRRLCVALPAGHVLLFKFRKTETGSETHVLDIPVISESMEEAVSPDSEMGSRAPGFADDRRCGTTGCELRVRGAQGTGGVRKAAGFQAALVCLQQGSPHPAATLTINSSYGLMAWGGERGLVIVDVSRRSLVATLPATALYGSEPWGRAPRSAPSDRQRSPSLDQVIAIDSITSP